MEFYKQNPFFRILIPFALGIAIGSFFTNEAFVFVWVLLTLPLALILHFTSRHKSIPRRVFFSLSIALCLMGLGVLNAQWSFKTIAQKDQQVQRIGKSKKWHSFLVVGSPKDKGNQQVYPVSFLGRVEGELRGSLSLKEQDKVLNIGTYVTALTSIEPIAGPQNPGQFDYRGYAHKQGLFFQANASQFETLSNTESLGFKLSLLNWRQKLVEVLGLYLEPKESGILAALLFGEKNMLSPEVKETYSNAGVMHVLAVSGMHVGMVYLVVLAVFQLLVRLSIRIPQQHLIAFFVIVFYAAFTGFSPSVMRASLMFGLFAASKTLQRNTSVYNILFASAFLLLVYDPLLLFSLSFQLSYVAVFGIVFLFPLINAWFKFKNKVLSYTWNIIALSLSAQLATSPLGFYYFESFPTYFLFSNLIIAPAVVVEMLGGMLLLLGHFMGFGEIMAWGLSRFLHLITQSLEWLNTLPNSSIHWSLSGIEVLLYYLLITVLLAFLLRPTIRRFRLLGGVVALLVVHSSWLVVQQANQFGIHVYTSPFPLAEVYVGDCSRVFMDTTEVNGDELLQWYVGPFNSHLGIQSVQEIHVNDLDSISKKSEVSVRK